MAFTVTASVANDTFGGALLQVEVLTNAALAGTPATVQATTAYNASITTTQAGSLVFGALENQDASTTFVAEPLCTIISQASINAGGAQGAAFKTTSVTGTPGSTLVGSSTAFPLSYGMVGLEIIPAAGGNVLVDASTPAVSTANTGSSRTTASFTPPDGSLLVAILAFSGNSGGGTCTATLSDTSGLGLTWVEQIKVNSVVEFNGYIGVWTAQVPASTAAPTPLQAYVGGQAYRRRRSVRRQQLPPTSPVAPVAQTTPPPVVIVPPNANQWFQGNEPIISFAPQTAPPVQSIQPPPVVQAEPPDPSYFRLNQPIQSRSSFQDVPAAIQPDVTSTSPDPRWFGTPETTILRNTLADPPQLTTPPPTVVTSQPDQRYGRGAAIVSQAPQAPPVAPTSTPSPIVVTSQPASVWLESNPQPVVRNTLQDPPVLTTPDPVVVTSQPDPRYGPTKTTIISNPQAPPPVVGITPAPVVVTSQPARSWFNTQAPFDTRNTTQDPPVLTTADPIVVTSQPAAAFFRTTPSIIRNPVAPVAQPTSTPRPVVVQQTGVAVGRGGRISIHRNFSVTIQTWRDPQHLGGSASDSNHLGGTVTGNRFGGTVTGNRFGGTVVGNRLGGTGSVVHTLGGSGTVQRTFSGTATVVDPWGGSLDEWTMQEIDINLGEFNDETLAVAITNGGSAYDLTGKTLQALFKTAAGVADSDPSTITLTSPSGGITITNAVGGLANVAIPRADLANANITFWRCDVVSGGLQNTAIFGKVAVTLL